MKPLTKSLHTVTAVYNVARLVKANGDTAQTLAAKALAVLGYNMADYAQDDATVLQIVKQLKVAI